MLIQPRRVLSPLLHLNAVPDSGVLTSILSKTSSTLRKEPSRPSHAGTWKDNQRLCPPPSTHVPFLLSLFKASSLGQEPEGGMTDRPAPGLKALQSGDRSVSGRS